MSNSQPHKQKNSLRLSKYIKYLPPILRAPLLRAKFEISYDFPSAFSLKQAETDDEIKQALRLVRQEPLSAFSKFELLPSTIILVAKWHDEVVGALSLVTDSAAGLPCENFSSLQTFRDQKLNVAEISTLKIKKDFRLRRRKLLFPLCKMMYQYCTEILNLDLILTSVSRDQAYFYTDVLLFKKSASHKNIYCLALTEDLLIRYKETYGHKQRHKNLYHFFIEHRTACILLPDPKCVRNESARLEIKRPALVFVDGSKKAEACSILNISEKGLQIQLGQNRKPASPGLPVLIVFEKDQQFVVCHAEVRWLESEGLCWGCHVVENSYSWQKFTADILDENQSARKAS